MSKPFSARPLDCVQRIDRMLGGYPCSQDDRDTITDLLADLVHWCRDRGIDWETAVDDAQKNYWMEAP